MSLIKTIKENQLKARKDKNAIVSSLLTTLIGEVNNEFTKIALNKRTEEESSDELVLKIIKKFIDNAKSTVTMVGETETTTVELSVLSSYLPSQLTKEEITDIINSLETGNSLGFVMKHFKENYNFRYDALELKQIVESLIKMRS